MKTFCFVVGFFKALAWAIRWMHRPSQVDCNFILPVGTTWTCPTVTTLGSTLLLIVFDFRFRLYLLVFYCCCCYQLPIHMLLFGSWLCIGGRKRTKTHCVFLSACRWAPSVFMYSTVCLMSVLCCWDPCCCTYSPPGPCIYTPSPFQFVYFDPGLPTEGKVGFWTLRGNTFFDLPENVSSWILCVHEDTYVFFLHLMSPSLSRRESSSYRRRGQHCNFIHMAQCSFPVPRAPAVDQSKHPHSIFWFYIYVVARPRTTFPSLLKSYYAR